MTAGFDTRDTEAEHDASGLLRFAHAAIHDLRSPLNAISNISQLLALRYADKLDERGEQYLHLLDDAARSLCRLVDNLVVYAEASVGAVSTGPTEAEEALAASLSTLQRKIENSGMNITHDPLPRVAIGSASLVRVFEHLLDNAISYADKDGSPHIRVSAARENGFWRFGVSDDGPGIASEYHGVIFEPFTKLHAPDTSGSGLGLSIVKALVERHGGRIWVESEPGRGSVFRFTLPAVD